MWPFHRHKWNFLSSLVVRFNGWFLETHFTRVCTECHKMEYKGIDGSWSLDELNKYATGKRPNAKNT